MANLFFLVFFCVSIGVLAKAPSLYEDSRLKAIFHYRNHRLKSSNRGFYLLPREGRTYRKEVDANLVAYQKNSEREGLSYKCMFPARALFFARYLKEEISFDDCQAFSTWYERVASEKLRIVWANNYPNNPASVFGHTFLRYSSDRHKQSEIANWAINFAAQTDVESGVIFAFKGVMGGYTGAYEISPYYRKIKEYIYSEGRDLFEFELDFTKEEIRWINYHLWELLHTSAFSYYFLDENCSFFLLELLHVGRPEEDFFSQLGLIVLPIETLRGPFEKKILKFVDVRPSLPSLLEERVHRLTPSEKKNFNQLPSDLSFVSTPTLDAIIAREHWKRYQDKNHSSLILHKALKERSKRKERLISLETEMKEKLMAKNPLEAHKTSSFLFGAHSSGKILMGHRMGLHSFVDPPLAYPEFSKIIFGEALVSFSKHREVRVEKLTAVDILSLYPYKKFDPKASWGLSVGADRKEQPVSKLIPKLALKGGWSLSLNKAVVGALLLDTSFWGKKEDFFYLGPRLLLVMQDEKFRLVWNSLYRLTHRSFLQDLSFGVNFRQRTVSFEGHLEWQLFENSRSELGVSVGWRYFF